MKASDTFPNVHRMLQSIGNRLLEFDSDTRTRLGRLTGKSVRLELTGVSIPLFFQIEDAGIRVLDAWEGPIHLTLRGSPMAFARISMLSRDAEIMESGVQIEGDAALAQQFANLLKQVDIDWEEWLSQYLGDIAAHQVGNGIRDLSHWARATAATFEQNLTEYLIEEAKVLAPAHQVQAFINSVDLIRADVERLEQRVRRLSEGA